jgi:hypothetical protein
MQAIRFLMQSKMEALLFARSSAGNDTSWMTLQQASKTCFRVIRRRRERGNRSFRGKTQCPSSRVLSRASPSALR